MPYRGPTATAASVLALLLSLVVVAAACAGGRAAPEGLDALRSDRLPRLRVERLLETGAASVPLDRLTGTFRVVRVGAVVDLPYVTAIVLEGPDGDRLRVLFDHDPEERLAVADGLELGVRFARHGRGEGRHETLALRGADGRLLFLAVIRPPGAAPSADEERLSPSLRPEPTDERVYREFLRQETYCTTERDHYASRLPDGIRWRRLAPGERTAVSVADRMWRVHLLDLSRVSRTDCADRPPDWLAYQVYGDAE